LVIVKIEYDLPDVETGVRLIEAVEQHALLHRRQAIPILDTVAADDLCHRIRSHEKDASLGTHVAGNATATLFAGKTGGLILRVFGRKQVEPDAIVDAAV